MGGPAAWEIGYARSAQGAWAIGSGMHSAQGARWKGIRVAWAQRTQRARRKTLEQLD
jgi:hypothetical protein